MLLLTIKLEMTEILPVTKENIVSIFKTVIVKNPLLLNYKSMATGCFKLPRKFDADKNTKPILRNNR